MESDKGSTDRFGLAAIIVAIVLILFVIYNAYYEVKQIIFYKLHYFKSFWNIVDLISITLNSFVCISEIAGLNDADLTTVTAVAVIFMWLKLFYFGRIFLHTASMVTMVIDITKDMKYFLIVFLLAVAGFGNCYLILARNDPGDEENTGSNYFRSFIYAYKQALGEFDTDSFTGTDKYLLYFIWFLNVIVTLIILLNLLIAIMGDTFDRVRESSENNMLKELSKSHFLTPKL